MSRIAITGASGFVGQAVVDAARGAGLDVVALSRSNPTEHADDKVKHAAMDLATPEAPDALVSALDGVDAVVHAAASLTGDGSAHARDTSGATGNLLQAMSRLDNPPKLILVSSFSVYDFVALPDFALMTEDSPLIDLSADRDAYALAKRKQEQLVADSGLPFVIVRPGAIYGPERIWSAQLGFAKAGLVVCPGGDALVPAVHVRHAAQSLVQAAQRDIAQGTVINLLDPDPPTQGGWLAALGMRAIFVSRDRVLAVGRRLGRGANWTARFKPLSYDARRARDLLGHQAATPFVDAVRAIKAQENG